MSKLSKWETLDSKIFYEDKWIKIRQEKCKDNNDFIINPYYILDYPDWVHLICFDENYKILITRQYRHGIKSINYEIPCGVVDNIDKTPLDTAKRELKEETGFVSENFKKIITYSPNPSNHSNSIHCFLVTDLIQTNKRSLDDSEEIEYEFLSFSEILKLINENKFLQSMHISTLFMALHHLKLIDVKV